MYRDRKKEINIIQGKHTCREVFYVRSKIIFRLKMLLLVLLHSFLYFSSSFGLFFLQAIVVISVLIFIQSSCYFFGLRTIYFSFYFNFILFLISLEVQRAWKTVENKNNKKAKFFYLLKSVEICKKKRSC